MIFFERTYEQNETSFLFIPTKKVSDSIINFRIGNDKILLPESDTYFVKSALSNLFCRRYFHEIFAKNVWMNSCAIRKDRKFYATQFFSSNQFTVTFFSNDVISTM